MPRRLKQLFYTSSSIERSLQKPQMMRVSLNLTLQMTGDDGAATTWLVSNADTLKTFIELPRRSGDISAEADTVHMPLVLTASGRRERAQVYEDILILVVSSLTTVVLTEVRFTSLRARHKLALFRSKPNQFAFPPHGFACSPITTTTSFQIACSRALAGSNLHFHHCKNIKDRVGQSAPRTSALLEPKHP